MTTIQQTQTENEIHSSVKEGFLEFGTVLVRDGLCSDRIRWGADCTRVSSLLFLDESVFCTFLFPLFLCVICSAFSLFWWCVLRQWTASDLTPTAFRAPAQGPSSNNDASVPSYTKHSDTISLWTTLWLVTVGVSCHCNCLWVWQIWGECWRWPHVSQWKKKKKKGHMVVSHAFFPLKQVVFMYIKSKTKLYLMIYLVLYVGFLLWKKKITRGFTIKSSVVLPKKSTYWIIFNLF